MTGRYAREEVKAGNKVTKKLTANSLADLALIQPNGLLSTQSIHPFTYCSARHILRLEGIHLVHNELLLGSVFED